MSSSAPRDLYYSSIGLVAAAFVTMYLSGLCILHGQIVPFTRRHFERCLHMRGTYLVACTLIVPIVLSVTSWVSFIFLPMALKEVDNFIAHCPNGGCWAESFADSSRAIFRTTITWGPHTGWSFTLIGSVSGMLGIVATWATRWCCKDQYEAPLNDDFYTQL